MSKTKNPRRSTPTPGTAVKNALKTIGPAKRSEIQERSHLSEEQTKGALIGLIQEGIVSYSDGKFSLVKHQ